MNYLQIVQEITEVLPSIQYELDESKTKSPYQAMKTFTEHIKRMIQHQETSLLFKCLEKLNNLYKNEDVILKNAIDNTFIYSLDNITTFCNQEYRNAIFNRLSKGLQKTYSRQIYTHGL